ncbi:MAG TPA: hypothetical protein VHM70_22785 [Polyangiaceae bacterium]|jgi:hypothetical protein|nr:hypothetical protein [Polyangiaceae bacterium]
MTEQKTEAPDPELEALPEPRRPWRRATLITLALTLLGALSLALQLIEPIAYATQSGQPVSVGDLSQYKPGTADANTWVHGAGILAEPVAGYRRPLDPDRFRIAPVEGNPNLWVEVREPSGSLGEHFIPPLSFIGHLVPLSHPGLRYRGLIDALVSSGQAAPPKDGWLLVDGESPESQRWVFGLATLLVGFAAFSAWGIYALTTRPDLAARRS